jgi:hydroxymethylcytosylglucuronate/cytosylglucuronate synthase
MPNQKEFSVLVATRSIGWGAVGKLRLILEKMPFADVVLHGDEQTIARTKKFLGPQHEFRAPTSPLQADVALVINDPAPANKIADLGIPVVYVDSIPFLRKTDTDIPDLAKITCYCAQRCSFDFFPAASPLLGRRQNIRWIDPIVPIPQSRQGGRGIVINVGGLYSYNLPGLTPELANEANKAVDAYLKLVLFPLVDFLQKSGREISAICGNLNADACARLRAMVAGNVTVGPQSPYAFERILADADLLITAPGTTTVLQAISIDLPTLLLPPQNRSQFPTARVYSKPDAKIMLWPERVIDMGKLERLGPEGVIGINHYIYKQIIAAANSQALSDEVLRIIRKGVSDAPADGVLNPSASEHGYAGADEVAQLLTEVARRAR